MSDFFEFRQVSAGYGPLTVLHEVSFSIGKGERVCLIGRNGVGKSTTLKTLMGLTAFRGGQVFWQGKDITRLETVGRARAGIGYVPQTRDVFASLSVEENLIAGLPRGSRLSDIERAYQLFPRLYERRRNGGTQLSGGEQQMLSVARTLLGNPQLLLLDEPLEGLAPIICEELMAAFDQLGKDEGVAILLVEQKVQDALAFSERALIMDHGAVVHDGPADYLLDDTALLDRYISVSEVPTGAGA